VGVRKKHQYGQKDHRRKKEKGGGGQQGGKQKTAPKGRTWQCLQKGNNRKGSLTEGGGRARWEGNSEQIPRKCRSHSSGGEGVGGGGAIGKGETNLTEASKRRHVDLNREGKIQVKIPSPGKGPRGPFGGLGKK